MTTEPTIPLETNPTEPVRVERRGNVLFADFGKAAYGNVRLEFDADVPAASLTVRLGEKLALDGGIDRKPPGSVTYVEAGLATVPGRRTYQPLLPTTPMHKAAAAVRMPDAIGEVTVFRYAEIECPDGTPCPNRVSQLAVHAPFKDDASFFSSSDPTLNAVYDLCKYTMKATTAFGVYIDGDRERIAYEADAYINLLSHYACDLDPRVARHTFDRLLAMPTWPTEWALHMPMIAAADYRATGDPTLAARHFDAIRDKLLKRLARDDGLLRASGIVDWPAGERDGYNDGKADPAQHKQVGPIVNTVVNAFYYNALSDFAVLADALHRDAEAAAARADAARVRAAFDRVFFDAERGIYTDGEYATHASLHANMFPLAFGLVPPERRKRVADFVQSRGMACSVYGAQYLLEALYQCGRADAAIGLMTARTDRSWWHMIELGSTMTLEAWNARAKPNLTWNHAWGAAPANIVARYVLGVRPLEPGYARTLVAPQPAGLAFFCGKVPTPKGPIELRWDAPTRRLELTVPAGTVASLTLPYDASAASVRVNGEPATVRLVDGTSVLDPLPPGRHVILPTPDGSAVP